MKPKSIYEWAVAYCGDPLSHEQRGEEIKSFLIEQGLRPDHKVLDVGCGALSQGVPLIRYLDTGNYTGLDPNGWLIDAALQQFPDLTKKKPLWSYDVDFNVPGGPYSYVVAHSVLSHVAQWQVEAALANIRQAVPTGAVWLASVRLSDEDTFDRNWVYPGVSFFRLNTLRVLGWHAGWTIEHMPYLRGRLTIPCPNDYHDWIKLTAIPTPESMNELRLADELDRSWDTDIRRMAATERRRLEQERLDALAAEVEAEDAEPEEPEEE